MSPEKHDDLENQLGNRLHRSADRLPTDHLLAGSRKRIARVRRRRMAVAAAAVVVAVAIPTGIVTNSFLSSNNVPAAPISATPSETSPTPTPKDSPQPEKSSTTSDTTTKPRTVDLRLNKMDKGAPPTVDYVREGIWHQASGDEVSLAVGESTGNEVRTFVGYGGGLLVASTARGNESEPPEVRLVKPDGSDRNLAVGLASDFTAGPDGSVIWIEREKLQDEKVEVHRLDRHDDETLIGTFPAASGDEDVTGEEVTVAVTKWFVFIDRGAGAVSKIDLGEGVYEKLSDYGKVLAGDPSGNLISLADKDGCATVLDDAAVIAYAQMCHWVPRAFSPGGDQLLAVHRDDPERAAILDPKTGKIITDFKNWANGSAPTVAFDGQQNANFMGTAEPGDFDVDAAIVTCSAQGHCHQATKELTTPYNAGIDPHEMIIPSTG